MKQRHSQPSERAQRLLKALVELYIEEGQPVGSKTLAQKSGIPVSSATIRNIMSDLEARGYVSSPHTSSGRVPTRQGYRFFVDSLLTIKPIEQSTLATLQHHFDTDITTQNLVENTSELLSQVTSMAGLVTVPKHQASVFRHIEFLPLSGERVLVILVVNADEVVNQIIHTDRTLPETTLTQAANYLNQHFAGKPLEDISAKIFEALESDRQQLNHDLQTVVSKAGEAIHDAKPQEGYVVKGESNLIDVVGQEGDLMHMRQLFEAFAHKRDVLHLLERCHQTEGVQIFIGKESGYEWFDHCSVVTAPYSVGGDAIGVLGIVGPTRMHYDRVVPFVDLTAKLLSLALDKESGA